MADDQASPSAPLPLKTLVWRGWRKRCPRCGQGPLFKRWLTLHQRCDHCDLEFLPDQGDLLGPMIFIDRVFFMIPIITVFCFIVPNAPAAVYFPCGCVMLVLLIFTMPNRNGACLALDYYLRNNRGW